MLDCGMLVVDLLMLLRRCAVRMCSVHAAGVTVGGFLSWRFRVRTRTSGLQHNRTGRQSSRAAGWQYGITTGQGGRAAGQRGGRAAGRQPGAASSDKSDLAARTYCLAVMRATGQQGGSQAPQAATNLSLLYNIVCLAAFHTLFESYDATCASHTPRLSVAALPAGCAAHRRSRHYLPRA